MNKKIITAIVDVVLIVCVFAIVEILSRNVFRIESVWLDVGLYVAAYVVVFGIKRGIVLLWNKKTKNTNSPDDKTK